MRKTHDYVHRYRGYWSDGGRCCIRIYREDGRAPVVIYSQPPDNPNTSVTNVAEYLAAEVKEEHEKAPPPRDQTTKYKRRQKGDPWLQARTVSGSRSVPPQKCYKQVFVVGKGESRESASALVRRRLRASCGLLMVCECTGFARSGLARVRGVRRIGG